MSVITKQGAQVAHPVLPNPPAQYDQSHMQQLVSLLNRFISNFYLGIELNATSLQLANLDTDTVGLRAGVVYLKTLTSGEKVLSIVLPGDPH
jgi:hypothetical protein